MPSRVVVVRPKPSVSITRFDAQQRAQHILIISSFFVLAITGLPLKYSNWAISSWFMGIWHGVDHVRSVHHWAAWIMIAACAYHLMYLIVSRPFSTAMLPKFSDLGDFLQDMKHTFHLSKKPPQFDRYSYRNKAAYWLVYPGATIMIVTGLMLLYPTQITARVSGWTLPLALMIHSDAAVLAVGWIVCVHMYFAHFSRHTLPFDKSVFTGRVSAERYEEEFPLEYARIMAAEGIPSALEPDAPRHEPEAQPEFAEPLSEARESLPDE
jgi:formate dehydrogenase subunit gamma